MKAWLASALLLLSTAADAQRVVAPPLSVTEERAADGTTTLTHTVDVDAAPDVVWTAIATPAGWRTWAVPFARMADGEPDVLETNYVAADDAANMIRQQITTRVPGQRIAFRTIRAPDGFPHFDAYRAVTSTFDVVPTPDGRTTVRLTATGFPDDDAGRALVAFFRDGNGRSLDQLRQRFVDGPRRWDQTRKP